jgi:hypothetical protein
VPHAPQIWANAPECHRRAARAVESWPFPSANDRVNQATPGTLSRQIDGVQCRFMLKTNVMPEPDSADIRHLDVAICGKIADRSCAASAMTIQSNICTL